MPFPNRQKRKLHGLLLDHPQDGDDRCRKCGGACCRSFSDVELSWEEVERLRALGATQLRLSLIGPHRLMIDYNCEFLVDGRCSIYEDRPDVCRRFTCTDATLDTKQTDS
ncbi:MAG TPA: YkgJ family cysteine cluster protein [Desulfuromonadaceae bacterium]